MRGTTRSDQNGEAIRASGAEAALGDPDRLGTLLPHVRGASIICWLMASAREGAHVHGPRLSSFLESLVDTPVRGFVYEGAGPARAGSSTVLAAQETYRMPVEVVGADPSDHATWLEAMTAAVRRLLA